MSTGGGRVGPPSGLLRRLAAIGYDSLLLFAVLYFATLVLLPFAGGAIAPGSPAYRAYLMAVGFLYFAGCWRASGQTLGMRAWRVRVRAADGTAVSWARCLARFSAALLSWACLGAGFLWSAVDRQRLAWHDRLSGTVLVVEPPRPRRAVQSPASRGQPRAQR